MKEQIKAGSVNYLPRRRVDLLKEDNGRIVGVTGSILEPSNSHRGEESSRKITGDFSYNAQAIVVTSGGIGANFKMVKENWPSRLGSAPKNMISGVPTHVDGRMLSITKNHGGRIVNRHRMWHYTEGIKNWNPVWPKHGIRILPGPSSLWFDVEGNRFKTPNFPGFDTLGTLEAIQKTGYDYSWFILTEKIIEREFALSGSEQNPDLTGKSIKQQIKARDREIDNKFTKDLQVTALRGARNYVGDKLIRVAKPHKIFDPKNGPLIAVKLNIISRKTLGGLQTDLSCRVLNEESEPIPGLYAAGEVSVVGGGGLHGYRSLEGTFLGGCLFTGKKVGEVLKEL